MFSDMIFKKSQLLINIMFSDMIQYIFLAHHKQHVTWLLIRGTVTWFLMRGTVTWLLMRGNVTWLLMRGAITWLLVMGTVTWLLMRGAEGMETESGSVLAGM